MSAMSEIRAKYDYCIEQAEITESPVERNAWLKLAAAWKLLAS